MTIEELSRNLRRSLAAKYGDGEAKAMVGLIFLGLKGWNQTGLVIHAAEEASEFLTSEALKIADRVLSGEPIQYVMGLTRFYGLDMRVSQAVLIPRPETEELVELIVSANRDRKDLSILDVGTGSGAIAIALARNLPFSRVTALDVSPEALEVARNNAKDLRAEIDFVEADIFQWAPKEGEYDIIVSNPPYIPEEEKIDMEENVLEHEPHMALFVPNATPTLYYRRIAEVARQGLKFDGELYFEVNPRFAEDVVRLMEDRGFRDVVIERDSWRRNRFVHGSKQG